VFDLFDNVGRLSLVVGAVPVWVVLAVQLGRCWLIAAVLYGWCQAYRLNLLGPEEGDMQI